MGVLWENELNVAASGWVLSKKKKKKGVSKFGACKVHVDINVKKVWFPSIIT